MTIHNESGVLCDATSLCEKVLDILWADVVAMWYRELCEGGSEDKVSIYL